MDVGDRFASVSVCKINSTHKFTEEEVKKAFDKVRNVANLRRDIFHLMQS